MVAASGRDDCGAIKAEDDTDDGVGNGAPHLDCLDCCWLLMSNVVVCLLLGWR